MHRDLKPENILCEAASDMDPDEISIKLTDFGFAVKYDPNGTKHTQSLGSPLYMAPELCANKSYDNKVDVWAVGVIAFILLTGTPPFYDRSNRGNGKAEKIYADIIKNEPDYNMLLGAPDSAINFIKRALKKNQEVRASVSELLEMPWMVEQSN